MDGVDTIAEPRLELMVVVPHHWESMSADLELWAHVKARELSADFREFTQSIGSKMGEEERVGERKEGWEEREHGNSNAGDPRDQLG